MPQYKEHKMKIQFQQSVLSPDYCYSKDQVIDHSERPADQLERWLKRGVVVPVKKLRKAVADNETQKAVTR